jgi:hypothetical protein
MGNHIPSYTGSAISLPVQLAFLTAIGLYLVGSLAACRKRGQARRLKPFSSAISELGSEPVPFFNRLPGEHYRPRRAVLTIVGGLFAGVAIWLGVLLANGNAAFGNSCRSFYGSQLPDGFWISAEFVETTFLVSAGLGMVLAWLSARYWARGIRADKTTIFLGGAVLGALAWFVLETVHVRLGHIRAFGPDRLALFIMLGGLLSLAFKPFLFRNGRFQFGIKSLLAVTAVWAVVLSLLCPEFRRYQQEEDTLAAIATVLGKPVQCNRMEGLSGVAHVNYVYLPKCTITEDQVDAIATQLRRLPRLYCVDISSATMSNSCQKRFRDVLPSIDFGQVSAGRSREEILPMKP